MPVNASSARAGAYNTIPIYKIICRLYDKDAASLAGFPNLFSKYLKKSIELCKKKEMINIPRRH